MSSPHIASSPLPPPPPPRVIPEAVGGDGSSKHFWRCSCSRVNFRSETLCPACKLPCSPSAPASNNYVTPAVSGALEEAAAGQLAPTLASLSQFMDAQSKKQTADLAMLRQKIEGALASNQSLITTYRTAAADLRQATDPRSGKTGEIDALADAHEKQLLRLSASAVLENDRREAEMHALKRRIAELEAEAAERNKPPSAPPAPKPSPPRGGNALFSAGAPINFGNSINAAAGSSGNSPKRASPVKPIDDADFL